MKKLQSFPSVSLAVAVACVVAGAGQARADYASTVQSLQPTGYYRFGGNPTVAADKAVNSGTAGALGDAFYIKGDPGTPMHGNTPGALAGSSDGAAISAPGLIQTPFDASINPTGIFTAEIWVSPTADPAGLTCPMAYGHLQNPGFAPNRSGWLLYQDNGGSSGGGGWNFRMFNHVGINRSLTLTGGPVPVVGSWYHVVVGYDGKDGFMYVNGVKVVSGPAPDYVANQDGNFSIGARNDLAFAYAGLVDEVALYPTALSASVIASHYENGTNPSRTTPYETLVKQASPLLYYRLNEPVFTPTDEGLLATTANSGSWGTSLNASIQDNVAMGQPGPQFGGFEANNTAARFNGLSGGIKIPAPPLNTDTVTYTAWVRRRGPSDSSQGTGGGGWAAILFQRGETAKATGFGFGDYNDLRYHWEDSEYQFVPNPRMVVPDNIWSFVAVSYSATQTVLCLNGELSTNVVAHSARDFSGEPLYIGLDPTGNRVVDGFIDEVAIFDKALTGAQLQSLYAAAKVAPSITAQPVAPGTLYEGQTLTLSVSSVGATPISYQWRVNGANISGATSATLTKSNVKASDAGSYDVVVTNLNGNVTSAAVSVQIVAGPPILVASPTATSVFPGGTVNFTSDAVGSSPITFQWFKDGVAIAGATSKTLSISELTAADAGTYKVVATNPNGAVDASAALTLLPTTPSVAHAIIGRGPIAYWRLNEASGSTVADSVGGFNGTFNSVTTKAGFTGPRPSTFAGLEAGNTGFSFDGNTSDIKTAPLNTSMAAGTIIAFIRPTGLPATDYNGIVYSRASGGQVAGLNVRTTTGNLGYNWNDKKEAYDWDSGLLPVNDTWNFVAIVVDPAQAVMYLDSGSGLQSAANAISHGPQQFNVPLHIGTDPSGNRIFGGGIDEVAIFNRALSPTEIEAIRNAAFSGTSANVPVSIVSNPKGQEILVGGSYTLTAQASGSQPLLRQWTKDGVDIPGAVRSSLVIANATVADSGVYRLKVTQGSTVVQSETARLTVHPVPSYLDARDGLVVHLPFDGSVADTSGRANNGTAMGNPAYVAGQIGANALQYKTLVSGGAVTSADYVSLGNPADLVISPGVSFSVSFWTQFTGAIGDLPFFGNMSGSYGGLGILFAPSYGEGSWSYYLNDINSQSWGGSGLYSPVKFNLNDGKWHNLVHTFDRTGNAVTYLDGVKVHSMDISGAAGWDFNSTAPWLVGQAGGGDYAEPAKASIDDLGFWRRALTEYESQAIYIVGSKGRSFDTVAPVEVNLTFQVNGSSLTIGYPSGTLESATSLTGPYTTVSGASAPSYTTTISPSTEARFYRVKVN